MAGATHPPETTAASARSPFCWSLQVRPSNGSGWNETRSVPIRKCLRRWAAGKAQRRLSPLARVWREATYREIPTVEYFRTDVEGHPSA